MTIQRFIIFALFVLFLLPAACTTPNTPTAATPVSTLENLPVSTQADAAQLPPTGAAPPSVMIDAAPSGALQPTCSAASATRAVDEMEHGVPGRITHAQPGDAPVRTLAPTAEPLLSLPAVTPALINTSLSPAGEPLGAHNLARLANVAQWGRGGILALEAAPDGSVFAIGSLFGVAIYDAQAIGSPARWLPFPAPFWYYQMSFSRDSRYLLFKNSDERLILHIDSGQILPDLPDVKWVQRPGIDNLVETKAFSPDGSMRFEGYQGYQSLEDIASLDEMTSEEISVAEMYAASTGKLLYRLEDQPPYVTIYDRSVPEGCDIHHFGYCGNAFMALATYPRKAVFSTSGEMFAVLYKLASDNFGTLRLYRSEDGELLSTFGSFGQPIMDFTILPGSDSLVIAFLEGSVQTWDIKTRTLISSAWDFNGPIYDTTYSNDGAYLLIQHPGILEIRRTGDGGLHRRYQTDVFALSPIKDEIAIASRDGRITIKRIADDQTVSEFQAHEDRVYALSYASDGRLLASSSQDCTARIWDTLTGSVFRYLDENSSDGGGEFTRPSRIFIYNFNFISGMPQLLGFGSWGNLVSWDTDTGSTLYQIEPQRLEYWSGMVTLDPHYPSSFGLDVDNNHLYLSGVQFDLLTGAEQGPAQAPHNLPAGCSQPDPTSLDGRLRFSLGYESRDGQICILDAAGQHLVASLQVIPAAGRSYEGLNWLYLSPDGRQLAVASHNGLVYVYQVMP